MTREAVVGLRLAVEDLRGVLDTLDDAEWTAPSGCPGWRTQDVVAHLSSNLQTLVEPPSAPAEPPALKAEQLMELLVEPRKDWSPAEVRAEFERYAAAAADVLESMQDGPAADTPITLAELGTWPAHQLADAYAFDTYCHLRSDVLAPRGSVQRAVPEPDDERLRPVVGWMLLGLPQMCREPLAWVDRPVGLVLDGPGGGEWTLVPGAGDLDVRPGLDAPAATVRSTAVAFVDWGTTRTKWREHVTLDGDRAFGERFCDAVDIV